jgi:hypothetical protein
MTKRQEAIQDLQVELREYNLNGGGIRRIEAMGRILFRLIDLELKRKGGKHV